MGIVPKEKIVIRNVLLLVLALLVQVPASTGVHAFPILTGEAVPCISAGDVIAIPAEYDGCMSSAVTQVSDTEWNYLYELMFASTVGSGAGDFVIPPLIDLLVLELADPTLGEFDILNPSPGFEGVGTHGGIYGALFRIDAMEGIFISFNARRGPRVGNFFASGEDGRGGSFTLSSSGILVPSRTAVPEPPTFALIFCGLAVARRKRGIA